MNERKELDLVDALVELYKMTSICLPEDVKEKIMETRRKEKNMLAKKVMDAVKENIEIAEKKQIPLCEDTGIPVFLDTNSGALRL